MEMKDSSATENAMRPPPPAYTETDTSFAPNPAQPSDATTTNAVLVGPTFTPVHPVVVMPQGNVILPKMVGPVSQPYICPSCNQHIVTKVDAHPTLKQHVCAAVLCVLGFWPCAPIPYCMPSCRKAHHYCPFCSSYIGTYKS